MAEGDDIASIYAPDAAGAGHAPPQQTISDSDAAALRSIYPQPPAPVPQPGFMQRAWNSIVGIPEQVWKDATTPGPPAALQDAPIDPGPLFGGIAHGARQSIDWGAEKLARVGDAVTGGSDAPAIRADMQQRQKDYEATQGSDSTEATIGRAIGSGLVMGGPLMRAGRLVGAGLEATGATALPGVARTLEYLSGGARAAPDAGTAASLATRGGSLAAQGGAVGGATSAIESDPDKSLLPQIAQGVASGAIAAPAVGSAVSAATLPLRAGFGLLPNMVRRTTAELADRLMNNHGIDLDPTQLTTNPTYRLFMDQAGKMPFSGAGGRIADARLQWQQALTREMGSAPSQDGITHDVMDAAATRIGNGMDQIANRTTIQGGTPLLSDMATIASDIPRFGLTPQQITPVRAQFRNILNAFQQGNGQINGQTYQNLVQTGGPLDSVIQSQDPTVHAFGMRLKDALDSAFQRSASPDDAAALQQLRYQYRVMKTVQPLVEQKGLTGDVDPNALAARVRAQSARFDPSTGGLAYTGGGRLGDLAYGGQIFFGRTADSGTAARNVIMAGLLGGSAGTALAHPATLAAPAATLAANAVLQRAMRSPQVGEAMVQNSLRPPGPWVQRVTPGAVAGLLGP